MVFVLVAACEFHHGALGGDAMVDPSGDANARDVDAAPQPGDAIALGPWGTPTLVITQTTDDDPTLTSDMLELYFNRSANIYVTKRTSLSSGWSGPAVVSELSTGSTDTTPEITGDGLTMFLASNRSGSTAGTNDIYVSIRATRDDVWGMPVRVDELSTNQDDNASAPTDDALMIVWNSGTPEELYATTRATPTSLWNARTALTSINTTSREIGGFLSQDRLTIYFGSTRDGNEDLYVATRATVTAAFSTPVPITELNTAGIEADPWVSADGRHMFFASARGGALGIYETTR